MTTFARYKHVNSSYDILDRLEAGIVLSGPEVKSVKAGQVNVLGSYVTAQGPHVLLRGVYIAPYLPAKGAQKAYDPKRDRQLLLSQKERDRLLGKLATKGLTMIPLSLYSKAGLVKVEIALVRGKSLTDRREQLKKQAVNRDIQRELKYRQ